MDAITLVLMAFGLAMDASAVSIADGAAMKRPRPDRALKAAAFFGSFQAAMPVAGWFVGAGLMGLISSLDHWIAFSLLSLIGCKMVYEAVKGRSSRRAANPMEIYTLLMLSVATSIDALVVGIIFALLNIPLLIPALTIGAVAFLLSFICSLAGGRFGPFLGNRAGVVGGVVLIAIGAKILMEHLIF